MRRDDREAQFPPPLLRLFAKIFIAIIPLVMATNELKRCVYRILGDLTKSDNVISVNEMDTLDSICDNMKITPLQKNESYSLTLADAVNYVAKQDRTVGAKIVKLMEECALKDGECCRAEALLISAVEIVNAARGQILSMPFNNRPILSTQIVYVDSSRESTSRRNELDKNYEELSRIAEMAGFELIYIPNVAKEFKRKKDSERLLSIVNPTLTPNAVSNKVMSLQEMDNRYFYLRVLNERCGSAGAERGINFEYDRDRSAKIQKMYIEAYHMVSNRESHFPDITVSSTFRPIKTKVMKALEACGVKEELHLFKPTKKGEATYYIPLAADNVKVVGVEGEIPLLNSTIYSCYKQIMK